MKKNNRIELIQGDITKLEVDAIVNAANSSLLGGGGVDGAIHRAAGPELLLACRELHGCRTGEAKLTRGFRLPARFVIHTVGPVWDRGERSLMMRQLADCYFNSLKLAKEHSLKSIAFPNISTGVYGFPKDLAAEIAIDTVRSFLAEDDSLESVRFVCFDVENYRLYAQRLGLT